LANDNIYIKELSSGIARGTRGAQRAFVFLRRNGGNNVLRASLTERGGRFLPIFIYLFSRI
jgi:hypothetical protein